MVDREVEKRVKEIIAGEMAGVEISELLDYLFRCRVLDVNKCRIAVIKRDYSRLVSDGVQCVDAHQELAVRYFKSENTIRNIVYNPFYKDLKI